MKTQAPKDESQTEEKPFEIRESITRPSAPSSAMFDYGGLSDPSPESTGTSSNPVEGQGVRFYYGGLDYAATVTKVYDADCIDLSVATGEHTFTREKVMRASGDDHAEGRWSPSTRKAARK